MDREFPPGRGFDPSVNWGAIWAGAIVAMATSFVLTLAASGLGFSLATTLANRGSLGAFTPTVGAYMIVVQVLSAGLGGYIAGRLRSPWLDVHDDESHFRDTAHGLIVWAVATLVGLGLAATVLGPAVAAMQASAPVSPAPSDAEALRAANIAAQSALFTAVGLLLSAFTAAVAARIGGMHTEHMHRKFAA